MELKRRSLLALLSLATIASSLASVVSVSAAGVTLLPSYKYIDVIPGKKAQNVPISIQNNTELELTFSVEIADFGALDDNGGPAIYRGNARPEYGLKNFASLNKADLVVPAGKAKSVSVSILNTDAMKPGGHYGAVLFTLQSKENTGKVKVEQVISSLLFITKKGGDEAKLTINTTKVSTSAVTLPKHIETIIQNKGNVHAVPEGTVSITDPIGKTVYSTTLNKERGPVLPGTIRKFTYQPPNTFLYIPGIYQLHIESNSGTYTEKFMILPTVFLAPLGLAVAIVAFIVGKVVVHRRTYRAKKHVRE